ncbi:MAG: LamG domain-containing protein [bacterium]|nr:LamG domain-containing protein [bacterium]
MKKKFSSFAGRKIFVFALCVLAIFPLNSTAFAGLEGLWYFNEGSGTSAYDSSSNSNTGTIYNASWDAGFQGSSLFFDGWGDYVKVYDDSSLDVTNGITIMAWINPRTANGRYIVHKGWNAGQTGIGGVYSLDIYPGTIRSVLTDSGSNTHVVYGSTPIEADTWQHIAVSWNGSTIKVYLNGQLDGSEAFSGTLSTSSAEVLIGRYGSRYFYGHIDNVFIYDWGLYDYQVLWRYNYERQFYIDPLLVPTKFEGKKEYQHNGEFWFRLDGEGSSGWESFFSDLYASSSNITLLLDDIGASTSYTNVDAEIWSRAGQVWNWLQDNQLTSSDANYNAAKTFYQNWLSAHGWISIEGIAQMYLNYGGFYWGTCMSRAQLFTTLLYRVGIPADRCGIMESKWKVAYSQHMYAGIFVYDRWLYLDPSYIHLPFSTTATLSIPASGSADYTHPNSVFSAQNTLSTVPLLYYSPDEIEPVPFVTFTNDFIASVYPGEGVTVHFDDVVVDGDTSVSLTSGTAPFMYEVISGKYYDIDSTTSFNGSATVSITYDESAVSGSESSLKLMGWDSSSGSWVNITKTVDTFNNTIYGETTEFSKFAVMRAYTIILPWGLYRK